MSSSTSPVLRSAAPADDAFRLRLYASTRAEELAPLGWSATQRDAFLRSQFAAQREHYRNAFPGASHQIVLLGKHPVGVLVVHRAPAEIRLVDLALLPEHRGAGLGTHLLRDLIQQARAARQPLRLHVLKNNPAGRLYLRLGFAPTGETGPYLKMEYLPT